MLDAMSPRPLVNDQYAKTLMGDDGLIYWEDFKHYSRPNGSNIARCFLIDGWIKKQLELNPQSNIILIGAGLDSRAYRLSGGNWVELDEPGIIEYKNEKLPTSQCKNSLQRIAIDFEHEPLAKKLQPFSHLTNVVFVIEGVLMYLTQEQRKALIFTLTALFPKHVLLCDLMNQRFFNRLTRNNLHVTLMKYGAQFKEMQENPELLLTDAGYRMEQKKSNVITASDFGLINLPVILVKLLMKNLLMGYSSYQFRFDH